jgi:hypothetical protein
VAGCGREERKTDESANVADSATPQPATVQAPSDTTPGTAIRTTDGNVEMALRGDRVQLGLSDKVLGQVRDRLAADSAGSSSGALGGMIKGIVRSSVQGALATRMEYPLDEIEEISYDGTRLRLVVRGKGPQLDHADVNHRPLMESFAPEDARRFVEAVRAAKARRVEAR